MGLLAITGTLRTAKTRTELTIEKDPNANCSPEEHAAYDEEIKRIRDNLPNKKAALKTKTATLATIRSAPSTDALRVSLTSAQAAKAQLEARLDPLRSGSVKPVSANEKRDVEREHKLWTAVRNKRKNIFNDLETTLLDSGAVTKDDLWVCLRATAPEPVLAGTRSLDEMASGRRIQTVSGGCMRCSASWLNLERFEICYTPHGPVVGLCWL